MKKIFLLGLFLSFQVDAFNIDKYYQQGFHYAVVPELKRRIIAGEHTNRLDKIISEIIINEGSEQFETLAILRLESSSLASMKYVAARKYLRSGRYRRTIELLTSKNYESSSLFPYILFQLASAYHLNKNYSLAVKTYERCQSISAEQIGRSDNNKIINNEMSYINQVCTIGPSRVYFEQAKYKESLAGHMGIKKEDFIWPELLFEEAWASFYLGNYNRTLGKLVTYRSPFLNHIFNPEVEILEALSMLELCRWNDVKKITDEFDAKYERGFYLLKKFVKRFNGKLSRVGNLARSFGEGKTLRNEFLNRVLLSITRDLAFKRYFGNLKNIEAELNLLRNVTDRRERKELARDLSNARQHQIRILGQYFSRMINRSKNLLQKAMQGMSYIKLELLRHKKEVLFGNRVEKGVVGDLKNVQRNDKQYLWDFDGEFWADELGDYVYSLESSCGE